MSRGPSKFYNYGDIDHPSSNDIIGVYEKADGSLGIPYELEGSVNIATRGSFSSEQAKTATEILNENYDDFLTSLILDLLDDEMTPVFEIIYPKNQIIVNYGKLKELVFIGTVDNKTGLIDYEKHRKEFQELCTVVKKYTIDDKIPEKTEGFVVQFKNGTCAKIKSDWYINLHKLLVDKDFYRMTLDSLLVNDNMKWIDDVPDEFYKDIEINRKSIENRLSVENKRLENMMKTIKETYHEDKDIALKIKQFSKESSFLFILWRKGKAALRTALIKSYIHEYKETLK